MDNLNNLLGFVQPGATVRIESAGNAVTGDPWPGIEDSDSAMQKVLDECVVWAEGARKPSGKLVRSKIAEWQASIPAPSGPDPAELDVLCKALKTKNVVTDADLKTAREALKQ